jgi:hypothetical protein
MSRSFLNSGTLIVIIDPNKYISHETVPLIFIINYFFILELATQNATKNLASEDEITYHVGGI